MCCLPYGSEKNALQSKGRAVRGIWEADKLFRCPLIGLGLDPAERKRLLKKMSFPVVELSPSEIHELFVNAAATENALSRKMSLLLRRKYEREAAPLRSLDEEIFLVRWKRTLAEGRYTAFLWAAATRDLSGEARREIYGDIHMTMHRERSGSELEAENASLRAELESLSRRLAEQDEFIRSLLRGNRDRLAPLREPSCPDRAEGEGSCCGRSCDASCPSFDLCRKRVLIVGGVERMEALYRDFIERGGGELDYHNGSLQGGTRQLEKSLRRADIILCPVNCNSHGACVKVKNLAKKHKKTFYMLPNGSLSTISRLLGGGQEGETR